MHMRMAGVLTLLALPTICLADLSTSVSAFGTNFVYTYGGASAACSVNGASTASCSQTATGIYIGGPFQGVSAKVAVSGSADASYGALFVTVSTLMNPEGGWMEHATASFSDALTILGGSGTGYISYLFDGSFTSITDPGGGTSFGVQQDGLSGGGFGTDTIIILLTPH